MKVLLVCAGGASTSILMRKMQKYAEGAEIELEVVASGVGDIEDCYEEYDILLLGPQISYQKDKVAQETGKPVMVISPFDYAVGNSENIFGQINEVLNKIEKEKNDEQNL